MPVNDDERLFTEKVKYTIFVFPSWIPPVLGGVVLLVLRFS
jgi:hypothetical protein